MCSKDGGITYQWPFYTKVKGLQILKPVDYSQCWLEYQHKKLVTLFCSCKIWINVTFISSKSLLHLLTMLHWDLQVWSYYEACHQSHLIVVVFLRQTVDYFIFPSQKQAIEIWKTRLFYFKTFFHSSIMEFYSLIFLLIFFSSHIRIG